MAISPFSAVNALVLLTQAANGGTLYRLKRKLNFTDTKSALLNEYVTYQQSLTESARDSTMIVANRLYVQQEFQINPTFQEVATQKLLSGVEMVNFKNATAAAKIINDFAAEKTHNKTGDVIKPASLTTDTKIVLMNTIYMKLTFDQVFQSISIDKRKNNLFTIYADDKNVHYHGIEYVVFLKGWFNYAELHDLNAKAIDIRFADSDYSLLLILPAREWNFAEFESQMKNYDVTKIIDQMRIQEVFVRIPIFQIKNQMSLRDISNQVGLVQCYHIKYHHSSK